MPLSPFRKGVLLGALVTGGLAIVAVAAAFAISVVSQSDDWPDPTATRRDVRGEVVSRSGASLCVSTSDTIVVDGEAKAVQVCGKDHEGAVADPVDVGDAVVGSVVDIEVDPGSGSYWSLWLDLQARPSD